MGEIKDFQTKSYWEERTRRGRAANDDVGVLYDDPRFDIMTERANKVLSSLIMPHWTVLDACCGYGRFSPNVADSKYTGVDFSEEMIAWAKERYPKKNFQCQSIQDCKGPFDCVFEVNSCRVITGGDSDFDRLESILSEKASKCIIIIESDNIRVKFSKNSHIP